MSTSHRALVISMIVLFAAMTYFRGDYSPNGLMVHFFATLCFFLPSMVMSIRNHELTGDFLEINVLLSWSLLSGFILLLLAIFWKRLSIGKVTPDSNRPINSRFALRVAFTVMVISVFFSPLLLATLFTNQPPQDSFLNSDLAGFVANLGVMWPLSAIGCILFWKQYKPWA